jgi:hypothetical protein
MSGLKQLNQESVCLPSSGAEIWSFISTLLFFMMWCLGTGTTFPLSVPLHKCNIFYAFVNAEGRVIFVFLCFISSFMDFDQMLVMGDLETFILVCTCVELYFISL